MHSDHWDYCWRHGSLFLETARWADSWRGWKWPKKKNTVSHEQNQALKVVKFYLTTEIKEAPLRMIEIDFLLTFQYYTLKVWCTSTWFSSFPTFWKLFFHCLYLLRWRLRAAVSCESFQQIHWLERETWTFYCVTRIILSKAVSVKKCQMRWRKSLSFSVNADENHLQMGQSRRCRCDFFHSPRCCCHCCCWWRLSQMSYYCGD